MMNKKREKLKHKIFSPKDEYKLFLTQKGKYRNEKNLKAFSDVNLVSAPAWSLGSRDYPPDSKDVFAGGGTHDVSKVSA